MHYIIVLCALLRISLKLLVVRAQLAVQAPSVLDIGVSS